jgi:heat shock protein HspQ
LIDKDTSRSALFAPGQQILHRLFDYRGLIFDVDAIFMGSDLWYDQMAKSRPPKDEPWYHVLVHGADHATYVAEKNLAPYEGVEIVEHPLLPNYFDGFDQGVYHLRHTVS